MRTKTLLCALSFCVSFSLLSGCEKLRDARPDYQSSKAAATLAAQEDELQAAIEERLTDSGSNIFSLSISDSSINVIFSYNDGKAFADECAATANAMATFPALKDYSYSIMKSGANQKLLAVWDSSGNYIDYSGDETSFQQNVTLDQLAKLESGQSQSSANSENTKRTLTTEDYIEANLRSYVSDYDYTTIDSITINEDAGTDTPDDYIALVNLTWSQKNSQETTKKMLDMYSQDMAARIYKDSSSVQEICIFWTIPYLNASAKWSFERGSNGMYATDQIFSN